MYAACIVIGAAVIAVAPDLVSLNVGVQVMNALLLPLVLFFPGGAVHPCAAAGAASARPLQGRGDHGADGHDGVRRLRRVVGRGAVLARRRAKVLRAGKRVASGTLLAVRCHGTDPTPVRARL